MNEENEEQKTKKQKLKVVDDKKNTLGKGSKKRKKNQWNFPLRGVKEVSEVQFSTNKTQKKHCSLLIIILRHTY